MQKSFLSHVKKICEIYHVARHGNLILVGSRNPAVKIETHIFPKREMLENGIDC